jgi:hypothetical protein
MEERRALRLRHAGGLTSAELAEALGTAEPEIERILEYARTHLRQSLVEAGCSLSAKERRAVGEKGSRCLSFTLPPICSRQPTMIELSRWFSGARR